MSFKNHLLSSLLKLKYFIYSLGFAFPFKQQYLGVYTTANVIVLGCFLDSINRQCNK